MKLVRAKVLGFCMGVRRAVEMAEAALAESAGRPGDMRGSIYTLGPLIHNPQVLESLAEKGMRVLEEADLFAPSQDPPAARRQTAKPPDSSCAALSNAAVIIRAHGVCPATEQKLRERGALIIDATCPRVKASQLAAREMAEKGYRVFLAGERDHAELKGIYGYALSGASGTVSREPCIVVGNPEEAGDAAGALWKEDSAARTALIGQTTISEDEYRAIAETIQKFFPALEVINTICGATRDRQNALRELCSQADAVIVAGGRDSANTRRLLSIAQTIAQNSGKHAWLVENAGELPSFDMPLEIVGISAGASTPDSVVDDIERALCAAYGCSGP